MFNFFENTKYFGKFDKFQACCLADLEISDVLKGIFEHFSSFSLQIEDSFPENYQKIKIK